MTAPLDWGTEKVGRNCGFSSASLILQVFTPISDSLFLLLALIRLMPEVLSLQRSCLGTVLLRIEGCCFPDIYRNTILKKTSWHSGSSTLSGHSPVVSCMLSVGYLVSCINSSLTKLKAFSRGEIDAWSYKHSQLSMADETI